MTADTCRSDPECSWCLSGAMPSACYTIEESQSLPHAVFLCDGVAFSEYEAIMMEFKGDEKKNLRHSVFFQGLKDV